MLRTALVSLAVPALLISSVVRADEIDQLNREIAARGMKWTAGRTSMTGKAAEFAAQLPSPIPPPNWKSPAPQLAPIPPGPTKVLSLPASWDWRSVSGKNWVTPVRSDGGNCRPLGGWAFSTVAAIEILAAYHTSTANPTMHLSEQNLVDCAPGSLACQVTSMGLLNASYVTTTGITSADCYPWVGQQNQCQSPDSFDPACQQMYLKADSSQQIAATEIILNMNTYVMDGATTDSVKTVLQARPVSAGIQACDDFLNYQSGVYERVASPTNCFYTYVALIGWNDTDGAWIIKNSWGPTWGENGFGEVKYGSSAIGLWSTYFTYKEDSTSGVFCSDFPTTITVESFDLTQGTQLKIANCGGDVLNWTATFGKPWLAIHDSKDNVVTTGAETSVAGVYKVYAAEQQPNGVLNTITFTTPDSLKKVVQVITTNSGTPDDDAGADGGEAGLPDGGTKTDGGSNADGGVHPAPPSSGCNCSWAGREAGGAWAIALGLGLGAALIRRRNNKK